MTDRLSAPAPQPSDAAARATALDTQRSFIVEAPAGSGKTGLLVQRFLKLLGEEEHGVDSPEEVLAMTFTRKATAEMSERILEQLQAAQNNHPLKENASEFELETRALATAVLVRSERLGWNLLAQPQRLNIRSILSVCMEIANSAPLLSSGGPYEPTETPASLYRLAARRTLLQLGGGDAALHEALRTILLHRDGNLQNSEALIANMLESREQWGELIPLAAEGLTDRVLDEEVRPRLEHALEGIVGAGLSRVARAMPAGMLPLLAAMAAQLAGNPGYKGALSPLAFCAEIAAPPEEHSDHLEHWHVLIELVLTRSGEWRKSFNANVMKFEMSKAEKFALQELIECHRSDPLCEALKAVRLLPPAKYPDEQWAVCKSLFRVLRHALAELKVLFAERGQCDYTELALATRELLSSGNVAADLTLATGGRLRHMLVDEMQDTSTGQYDLIRLLTQSWDGRSQTLFLVGDPKQSIYLFRQARVERFLRTLQEAHLGEIELTALRLTANFRSQAALVQDFNTTFGGTSAADRIFPPPNDPSLFGSDAVDVPFVEASPVRSATSPSGIHWHVSVVGEEDLDAAIPAGLSESASHAAQEAIAIRGLIEEDLARPLPAGRSKPWRIAVLARSRNHLSAVVEEFKAHDGKPEIPYRAVDLDPLAERPEVQDVLALTRALLHPADRIAWLAVLHAPWCGLSLADLLALTHEGSAQDAHATIASLAVSRLEHLSPEGQQLLLRAWPVLQRAVDSIGATPLSVHVERTWRSLGGDAALTPEQRTNVESYFDLLRKAEAEGVTVDLKLLNEDLSRLYATPRHGEIQVDLLTIHAAKGLEWDYVFVPGLERRPRGSTSVLLNWLEFDGTDEEEAMIVLAPIWGKGEDSDRLNNWLRSVRARRERAEEKRLFYVAATRAREELHLFAACSRRSNQELAQPAYASLLRACWPAAQQHFANLPAKTHDEDLSTEAHKSFEEASLAQVISSNGPALHRPPLIQRLPDSFDPQKRFQDAFVQRISYLPAASLPQSPAFDRPEGSFAVRAFGNVVHRYLQQLAEHLKKDAPEIVLSELSTWEPRLLASLRGEGLPSTAAAREAARALRALQQALQDDAGRWILSSHPNATSESEFSTFKTRTMRADRIFFAGNSKLSIGNSHIWIIDFKTSELGARSEEAFQEIERIKYKPQLEAYAALQRTLSDGAFPIRLGLYYPLIPCFIAWEFGQD